MLDTVRRDLRALTRMSGRHLLMEPAAPWEALRIGAGTPPLRTDHGWLLLYHGVTGHIAAVATEPQDVRYAVRALGHRAGFAAVTVGTLALGIGATTLMFTVIEGVLLKPLAFHDPGPLGACVSRGYTRLGTFFRT